jgi:hypothetical protein
LKRLPRLVRLGLALVVLDVYPRVTGPWHLEHSVRRPSLPGFPEMVLADPVEIRIAHFLWVVLQRGDKILI